MNNMIEFAKNNRTTDYFKNFAIQEIRIAYRVMEYLMPDSVFPAKDLSKNTMNDILSENLEKAYEAIVAEVEDKCYMELGSGHGYETIRVHGIELIKYLLPLYKKECKDIKEQKRITLLEELKKLDNDEGDING